MRRPGERCGVVRRRTEGLVDTPARGVARVGAAGVPVVWAATAAAGAASSAVGGRRDCGEVLEDGPEASHAHGRDGGGAARQARQVGARTLARTHAARDERQRAASFLQSHSHDRADPEVHRLRWPSSHLQPPLRRHLPHAQHAQHAQHTHPHSFPCHFLYDPCITAETRPNPHTPHALFPTGDQRLQANVAVALLSMGSAGDYYVNYYVKPTVDSKVLGQSARRASVLARWIWMAGVPGGSEELYSNST